MLMLRFFWLLVLLPLLYYFIFVKENPLNQSHHESMQVSWSRKGFSTSTSLLLLVLLVVRSSVPGRPYSATVAMIYY